MQVLGSFREALDDAICSILLLSRRFLSLHRECREMNNLLISLGLRILWRWAETAGAVQP